MKLRSFNYYLGAAISSWFLVAVVIAAELVEPFKEVLKSTFSHHWIGKAVIVAVAFVVFGFLFMKRDSIEKSLDEKIAWYSVIGSLVVITLFYVILLFV